MVKRRDKGNEFSRSLRRARLTLGLRPTPEEQMRNHQRSVVEMGRSSSMRPFNSASPTTPHTARPGYLDKSARSCGGCAHAVDVDHGFTCTSTSRVAQHALGFLPQRDRP